MDCAGRTPPDGPPRVTAFSLPTITPPIVIISSRVAERHLYQAGPADAAVYGNDLGAGIALAADAVEPFAALATMAGTMARVSRLFTTVDGSHKPCCAGKGDADEAPPKRPSRVVISAVSSPQTYPPLPSSMTTSKLKALPRIFSLTVHSHAPGAPPP